MKNRVSTIHNTVAAVRAQSHDRFTLTLVDDGSDDGTTGVLLGMTGPRVFYVRLEGCGPSAARNAGAASGTGEWITFVDCDDEPKPEWLSTLMAASTDADLVSCAADIYRGDVLYEHRSPRPLGLAYYDINAALWPGMFAVRRSVFEKLGGYDEDIWFGENFELGMRISAEVHRQPARVVAVDESLIAIHQPATGVSQSSHSDRLFKGAEKVLTKHAVRLAYAPRLLASYHAIAGVNALRLGLAVEARRHLRLAVSGAPLQPKYWLRLAQAVVTARGRRRKRSGPRLVLHVAATGSRALSPTDTFDGHAESRHHATLVVGGNRGTADYCLTDDVLVPAASLTMRSVLRLRRALGAIDPDRVVVHGQRLLSCVLRAPGRTTDRR
ncbi:MAG: glycosyltransferase family A protein [Ilumatobacteraceae bacterium]